MTCEKCSVCGLVLDNHDHKMAMQCLHDATQKVNAIYDLIEQLNLRLEEV